MKIVNEKEAYSVINKELSKSKYCIWITSPWIALRNLDKKLKGRKDVRIAVRFSKGDDKITDFELLKRLNGFDNVEVRCSNNLHAKIYIFDDKVIISSSNLTQRGLGISKDSNVEMGVVSEDKELIEDAKKRFLEIWDNMDNIEDYKIDIVKKKKGIRDLKEVISLFRPKSPLGRL